MATLSRNVSVISFHFNGLSFYLISVKLLFLKCVRLIVPKYLSYYKTRSINCFDKLTGDPTVCRNTETARILVMLLAETLLFSLSLIDSGAILFLLVYYIITLSDLECDYLNAQECCDKLNYWLLPKYIAHSFITFLLLLHGQLVLFILNLPMFIWLTYEYFTIPQGNLGAYDPAEIHNRGQLRKHLRDVMIYVGHYLIFFFIYLYCFILALLKGNPIPSGDDQIVTEI